MLLITRTQVVRVDKLGLYILGIGRLLWPDLRQAWAGRTAGSTYLAITFSDSYVRKRPVLVRLIFWLRSLMSRSHAVIPFSGLNSDAIQVVDAINLRHHTGHIDVPRVNIASSPNLFWCNLLSVVCPIMVFYRCFTQESIETPDYLPYIIIFVLCRLYAVVKLIRFSKVSGL